jgi:hypothetical protein
MKSIKQIRTQLMKQSKKTKKMNKNNIQSSIQTIDLHLPNLTTMSNQNLLTNNRISNSNYYSNSNKSNNNNDDDDNYNYIVSEVIDDATYNHFKSLINQSPNLCKGQTQSGKKYKIRKSILKNMSALKKDKHYRIIYIHNNNEIIAYVSTKLYTNSGGFMFIHKLCSNAGTGQGKKLFNMILDDARTNYEKLGITYLSLTTQNLDIVNYYKQFNPTRVIEVDPPGSKAKNLEKCAYMIWQVSPNMPYLNYA